MTVCEKPLSCQDMSPKDRLASEIRLLQHFESMAGTRGKIEVIVVQAESLRLTAFADINARIVSVGAMRWRFLQALLDCESSCAELFSPSPPSEFFWDSYRLLNSFLLHNPHINTTLASAGALGPATAPDPVVDADIVNTWQFRILVMRLDLSITLAGLTMRQLGTDVMAPESLVAVLIMSIAHSAIKDCIPPQLMARALHLMGVLAGHNKELRRGSAQLNIFHKAFSVLLTTCC